MPNIRINPRDKLTDMICVRITQEDKQRHAALKKQGVSDRYLSQRLRNALLNELTEIERENK